MPLTIQILCENDQDTIEQTIQSVLPLEEPILIGNCDSTDGTLDICRKHKCKIITFKGERDEIRNHLVSQSKTDWQLYIDPGETLSTGHDLLTNHKGINKKVFVVYDNFLTKETRIWKKGTSKFVNPVYETLTGESELINVAIAGCEGKSKLKELLLWKSKYPHASEVDYYLACQYLILKDNDNFFKSAEYYLYKDGTPSINNIMIHYYLAQAVLHMRNDSHGALRHLVSCLAEMPLMAEFWCVIGDCFYRAGVPEKAIEFFKIAIEMGKGRNADDPYPVEFAKYLDYPNKMIDLCNEIKRVMIP